VVDGLDPSTVRVLEQLHEPRIHIVELEENVGGSEARNIGARVAKGEWIALLDDDDEWLPEKIERQVAFAVALKDKNAFVACRFRDGSPGTSRISPMRMPSANERIDEYLYCPKGFRTGEGFLQTSTLLVSRELMLRVPFVRNLKRGQEVSWMMRACSLGHATFHVVPEVLSSFNSEGGVSQRVSANPKWRSFYSWMQASKSCFIPKAYSFCIATSVLPDAITCGEPFAVKMNLLRDCILDGRATPKCLLKFMYALLLPLALRSKLKTSLRLVDLTHS
jgi:glycosyltransferase involved in cell wall biosynthesis